MKKRIIPVILSILFLFGCAKEEAAPENEATQPTRKPILAEIVSAYDIGATGEKQVSELFESFDKAFDKLAKSSVEEDDFYTYARAVKDAVDKFEDEFDSEAPKRKLDSTTDKSKTTELIFAMSDRANALTMPQEDLSLALIDLNGNGEHCAELAVEVVNAYSSYYYGEVHLTDDDLDQLG